MIVVVSGSRSIRDDRAIWHAAHQAEKLFGPAHILHHGGADGVDDSLSRWARENSIQEVIWYPNWNKHGKPAGMMRTAMMIAWSHADYGIVVWDGKSRGTKFAIEKLREANIPYHLVALEGGE